MPHSHLVVLPHCFDCLVPFGPLKALHMIHDFFQFFLFVHMHILRWPFDLCFQPIEVTPVIALEPQLFLHTFSFLVLKI